MVTLKRLYFEPGLSRGASPEIVFKKGVNFVIGERSESLKNEKERKKMNGVGKSVLIEAINFCLLKDLRESRIGKIPDNVISNTTHICLDLEIENSTSVKEVTIKRSRDRRNPIIIIDNQKEQAYESESDAMKRLESFFFEGFEDRPSLRSMLSLLIRDEKSAYDNILYPYQKAASFGFSDLVKPHLYLFGFDLTTIDGIKALFKKLDQVKDSLSEIKRVFTSLNISEANVRIHINDLRDKVEKLDLSLGNLEPSEGLHQQQEQKNVLSTKLQALVQERSLKQLAVRNIKHMPKVESVPLADIQVVYNQYKIGLGDFVKRSLEDVLAFKKQVEDFQSELMTEKLTSLNKEISQLNDQIGLIDVELSRIYSSLNAGEKIDDLKKALKLQIEKSDELSLLAVRYKEKESKEAEKRSLETELRTDLDLLDRQIESLKEKIEGFEADIIAANEYIAGNKACQFSIKTSNKAKYLDIEYRVVRDGSSGVNRVKTFIYDVTLMLNKYTKEKHFGFLVHDNIFASVGKDDLVKSLNFIALQEQLGKDFQYILTINTDEFDSSLNELDFDYELNIRKRLTRQDPFLGELYSEL